MTTPWRGQRRVVLVLCRLVVRDNNVPRVRPLRPAGGAPDDGQGVKRGNRDSFPRSGKGGIQPKQETLTIDGRRRRPRRGGRAAGARWQQTKGNRGGRGIERRRRPPTTLSDGGQVHLELLQCPNRERDTGDRGRSWSRGCRGTACRKQAYQGQQ